MKKGYLVRYTTLFILFTAVGFIVSRTVSSAFGNYIDANNPRSKVTDDLPDGNKVSYPIPNLVETISAEADFVPSVEATQETISKPIQENILVILIDDIEKNTPTIEAVWLLLYFTDSAHLTLMPIYPSLNTDEDRTLVKLFDKAYKNKANGIPGEKFFTTIKEKEIWWDGYLVLDHTSLLAMSEIANQASNTNTSFIIEDHLLRQIALARENTQKALEDQTALIQSFCQRLSIPPSPFDYSLFSSDNLKHIRTDLDLAAFIDRWNKRIDLSGQLSCEFPYLTINK